VEVVGIVGTGVNLTDVTRIGGTGTLELARGTLEALLDTRLEELELVRVLGNVVGHGKVFLETVALGSIGMTVADGTGSSGSGIGGVGRLLGGELVDQEVDSGVQVGVRVSIVSEGDIASFTVGVTIAMAVRGAVAIAVGSLVAPERFLDDGLGGTREGEVVRESSTNKLRGEFPAFLLVLPIFVDFLSEPIGVEGVADEEVQTVLAGARALLAIFEIEEVEAALRKLQNRFVVLLARSRGSEGAGAKGQLGVDVLKNAVQGSVAVIVGGGYNVDEGAASWESARLHEGSGD
jgi:hypothetical protein